MFKNTKTGNSCYLLDKLLEIESHTRMSEDVIARMLEEAADSNYRKGGAKASISGSAMTKETVMNKLHELEFPKTLHEGERKTLIHCILMQMRIMYLCSIWKRRAISRNQESIQSCLD